MNANFRNMRSSVLACNKEMGDGQGGFVLILTIMLISVLCFIAGTTLRTVKPEIQGAGYHKNERKAFYAAEAGVQYAVDNISRDLQSGELALTNDIENISYSAPDGYEFDTITRLRRMADNRSYMFTVTGHCQNARAVIEVTVRRPRVLPAGMFGDEELRLQPNIEVYSYDSSVTTDPAPANSTGEANAGSNGNITVRPGVVLDGVFLLGEDEFGFSPAPISGYDNQEVGRIDPDPLGASTGMLAEAFAYYSDPNHNDNAAVGGTDDGDDDDGAGGGPPGGGPPGGGPPGGGPPGGGGSGGIDGNSLDIGPNESLTIPGGHYYLEELYVGPNSTLNLTGNTADPVVFFLTGEVDIKPNSEVVTASGRPTDFQIFSNSDDDIKLFPNGDFEGLIYAPYADINLQPNNTVRGVVIGKDLTIKPGAESFIDTSLLDSLDAPYVEVTQWRHATD